jgi:hypothetical protein
MDGGTARSPGTLAYRAFSCTGVLPSSPDGFGIGLPKGVGVPKLGVPSAFHLMSWMRDDLKSRQPSRGSGFA